MIYMNKLRNQAAIAIVSLLWINLGLMGLRAWWGMDADPAILLGGGAAIAAAATLTWWHDRTGTATQVSTALALAASVALLVYAFSGSPLQIDVHMYFFASLAICAAWVDWRAILAFASFTALHHLVLYLVLPAAVFPGAADIGRVVLHAVILVVEAGALLALGRSLAKAFVQNDKAIRKAQIATDQAAELSSKVKLAQQQILDDADLRDSERSRDNERLQTAMDALGRGLHQLAQGDLRFRLTDSFDGSLDKLRGDFNSSMETLEQLVAGLSRSAREMRHGSNSVFADAEHISQRTEQQAVSLEQTAAAIDRITGNVQTAFTRAGEASQLVVEATEERVGFRSHRHQCGQRHDRDREFILPDRHHHQGDRRHCVPDQPAGTQCRCRGRPRR
ncbi:methyl-accepting chemotaxis protein [Hoeflea ulvae]|uniref:Methyl-accepting chemotaxis protein n=1 Tax=Hoeflea ulvae TaxID=2983764 RepID=A0ABT3YHC8_9HYPH|nr:methyl-accepting chemotaxis protein [Hoeflea ulvae]MCY0095286.1 methyl-accepting chemotaxis protein [Hoeflea ulvae]